MTTLRMILAMIAGASAAYAVVALIPPFGLTIKDFGCGAAVTALCWLLIGLLKFVESQSYHPNSQHRRTP